MLVLTWLAVSNFRVMCVLPLPTEIPPSIARDQQGALRYLWEEIQHNMLWKALPERYSSIQPAWTDFLHAEAWSIIQSYYS